MDLFNVSEIPTYSCLALAAIVLKRENNVGLIDVFPSINHFSIVKRPIVTLLWVQSSVIIVGTQCMTPIEIGRSQNQIPIKDIFAANCSLQQNETISFTLLKQVHTSK